jgi:glycosyltransferase involved in cell wall biosynthesis
VHINRLACWVQTMSPPTVPTVATMHVPAEHDGLPLKLRQRVFARANALVVPSKDLGQWLVERLPELQSKLRVVPHGMEEPTYPASSLRSDPFTFLCLGRLVPEKGFEVALRALAATGRRDLRLIIVGEGSAEPALRECAVQLKIAGQVEFRGWVHPDRVASLIDEATVVLMPSLWREPFGLVAVQAAQMGRPIIASRVGGIPEIVVDGVTGRLVAPGDPAALALVMTELVHDSLQLANLGAEASTWARQRFNIAECSRRYFSIYREQVSIPGGEADA